MELKGKTAIVTGGSRGIGKAIAADLAQKGASVAILYCGNDEAANKTVEEIKSFNENVSAFKCDVQSYEQCEETVKKVLEEFKKIDILVNNAGIVRDNLVLKMTEKDFDDVLATNLKGAFNMIKQVYPLFMRQRTGRIINISSVSGLMGNAGQANYSSAKAGLIGLTKTVAKELASRGVTCNAVAPGFIETEMTAKLSAALLEEAVKSIPLKRMGAAKEIASLVSFLASDLAAYITGEVIKVDGGLYI